MRRALPALVLLAFLAVGGCTGEPPQAAPQAAPTPSGYSQTVRTTFLGACVDNARNTSQDAVSDEQLAQTCTCILTKVEQEYSEAEFAAFEQRLLGGDASDEESGRLVRWSTDCAREAAG